MPAKDHDHLERWIGKPVIIYPISGENSGNDLVEGELREVEADALVIFNDQIQRECIVYKSAIYYITLAGPR